jgi:hypothetical protein
MKKIIFALFAIILTLATTFQPANADTPTPSYLESVCVNPEELFIDASYALSDIEAAGIHLTLVYYKKDAEGIITTIPGGECTTDEEGTCGIKTPPLSDVISADNGEYPPVFVSAEAQMDDGSSYPIEFNAPPFNEEDKWCGQIYLMVPETLSTSSPWFSVYAARATDQSVYATQVIKQNIMKITGTAKAKIRGTARVETAITVLQTKIAPAVRTAKASTAAAVIQKSMATPTRTATPTPALSNDRKPTADDYGNLIIVGMIILMALLFVVLRIARSK